MGEIVEESLELYGIKTTESASELVRKARKNAGFTEARALRLAVKETGAGRRG